MITRDNDSSSSLITVYIRHPCFYFYGLGDRVWRTRVCLKQSLVSKPASMSAQLWPHNNNLHISVTFKYELIEPLLIFTICYVSYLVAEMMELSAILAIIFCAFVMMHRVDKRLSKDSHVVIRNGLKESHFHLNIDNQPALVGPLWTGSVRNGPSLMENHVSPFK